MFVDLPGGVVEAFEQASQLGTRREFFPGMRIFRRVVHRYIESVPCRVTSEPCACGGAWEWREGAPRAIHVGAQGRVRCARPSGTL